MGMLLQESSRQASLQNTHAELSIKTWQLPASVKNVQVGRRGSLSSSTKSSDEAGAVPHQGRMHPVQRGLFGNFSSQRGKAD